MSGDKISEKCVQYIIGKLYKLNRISERKTAPYTYFWWVKMLMLACSENAKLWKVTNEQDGEVCQGEAEQEIVGGGVHALVPIGGIVI